MTTLYQFPLSHFCEKARWALDYHSIPHQQQTVLPGLHYLRANRMGLPQPTLPILRHNGRLIQNSSAIITYLDQHYPNNMLTPIDPTLKQQALDWEAYVDQEIGPHIRRVFYAHALPNKKLTFYFFALGAPVYGRVFLHIAYPIIRRAMQRTMNITPATTKASIDHLKEPLAKLQEAYSQKPYLIGDRFTRADLAAAALLAPPHKLPQYGIVWPHLPAALEEILAQWIAQTPWLPSLYQHHRPSPNNQ